MRLNETVRKTKDGINGVYLEAKSNGYDINIIRKVVSILESKKGRCRWNDFTILLALYIENAEGDARAPALQT